ncbi:hypothetical protein D3C75_1106900 [compost metagenome]
MFLDEVRIAVRQCSSRRQHLGRTQFTLDVQDTDLTVFTLVTLLAFERDQVFNQGTGEAVVLCQLIVVFTVFTQGTRIFRVFEFDSKADTGRHRDLPCHYGNRIILGRDTLW